MREKEGERAGGEKDVTIDGIDLNSRMRLEPILCKQENKLDVSTFLANAQALSTQSEQ